MILSNGRTNFRLSRNITFNKSKHFIIKSLLDVLGKMDFDLIACLADFFRKGSVHLLRKCHLRWLPFLAVRVSGFLVLHGHSPFGVGNFSYFSVLIVLQIYISGGSFGVFIIDGNRKLSDITLLLTVEEAKQLQHKISDLLSTNEHHVHVSSDDYQTETNISILEKNSLETYHPAIRKIISEYTK